MIEINNFKAYNITAWYNFNKITLSKAIRAFRKTCSPSDCHGFNP